MSKFVCSTGVKWEALAIIPILEDDSEAIRRLHQNLDDYKRLSSSETNRERSDEVRS